MKQDGKKVAPAASLVILTVVASFMLGQAWGPAAERQAAATLLQSFSPSAPSLPPQQQQQQRQQQLPDPGVAIATASGNAFQSGTFSVSGPIASLAYAQDGQPLIVAGYWSLDADNGNVTSFEAGVTVAGAGSAAGERRDIHLANFVPHGALTLEPDGTALAFGRLDMINVTGMQDERNNININSGRGDRGNDDNDTTAAAIMISIENFNTMSITLDYAGAGDAASIASRNNNNYLAGQPIYGLVDQQQGEAAASLAGLAKAGALQEGSKNTPPAAVMTEGNGMQQLTNATNRFGMPELPDPLIS